MPYGEAGDCYSLANCPQGRFSINLSGTGLRVADHSTWIGVGNKPSVWLQRIQVCYNALDCTNFFNSRETRLSTGSVVDTVAAVNQNTIRGSSWMLCRIELRQIMII